MIRVGLGVGYDAVRGVAVRGGAVIWASEVQRTDPSADDLGADLIKLLSDAPRPRLRRLAVKPVANVAVGPSCAQMRRLVDLPPLDDPRLLARVIREGAPRFFLRNGIPLATTGVRVVGVGEAWAAALEQPVVDATAAACRAAGLKLRTAVPAVGVLAAAVAGPDARLEWRDGPVCAELTVAAGRLASTRRLPAVQSDAARPIEPPVLVPALAGVGERAWSYADAYGAAVLAKGEPVVLRLGNDAPVRGSVPGWRLTLASAACLVGAVAAVTAPGVASMYAARIAARELAALGPAQRAVAADELDLRRVDAALAEIGAFMEVRRSPTLFLDKLAEVLPRDVSLISVRLDSLGGHVVALAPRAASVLAALDSVPNVAALEIVGPVTKEVVGSGTAGTGWSGERATIRFRWAARAANRR